MMLSQRIGEREKAGQPVEHNRYATLHMGNGAGEVDREERRKDST